MSLLCSKCSKCPLIVCPPSVCPPSVCPPRVCPPSALQLLEVRPFLSSAVFPEQRSAHGKPSINSYGMNKSLNKGANEESQFRWSNVMKKVNRLESPCEARQAGCFFKSSGQRWLFWQCHLSMTWMKRRSQVFKDPEGECSRRRE